MITVMKKAKIKQLYQKSKPYLKYIIVTGIFVFIMIFGKYGCIKKMTADSDLRKLEEKNAYYEQEIESVKSQLEQMKSNKDDLERLAREKYGMKKENEDVFIIVEK